MPDKRSHRGPHPEDGELFAPDQWPLLRQAVADLSWLLGRGYSQPSALKLVGDHYQLRQRQRTAVMRCACSDQAREDRVSRRVEPQALAGNELSLDGYNILTTVEAALAGGVLLLCRDGCLRDMASMHGSFRKVRETGSALELIGQTLAELRVRRCEWYLDRPVSNSGRLKTLMNQIAAAHGWEWEIELVISPDAVLARLDHTIATADSVVLDRCGRWFNLGRHIVSGKIQSTQWIDLGECIK